MSKVTHTRFTVGDIIVDMFTKYADGPIKIKLRSKNSFKFRFLEFSNLPDLVFLGENRVKEAIQGFEK